MKGGSNFPKGGQGDKDFGAWKVASQLATVKLLGSLPDHRAALGSETEPCTTLTGAYQNFGLFLGIAKVPAEASNLSNQSYLK